MPLLVLEVCTAHGTDWLLTDDLDAARAYLTDTGGVELAIHHPADVLADQYDGIALLSTLP